MFSYPIADIGWGSVHGLHGRDNVEMDNVELWGIGDVMWYLVPSISFREYKTWKGEKGELGSIGVGHNQGSIYEVEHLIPVHSLHG